VSRTLSEWLDYQSNLNTRAIELGLDRVAAVWHALGAPAPAPRVITVAGTNGKGSSVAFLEAILGAAGYRTGCYTSPHLLRYNERIRIDGRAIDDASLCAAFERVEQARGDVPLTYFEFGTLAALCCMAQAILEVAILEVGLGGRLDAVNIIDPDVGLITGIALDHTDWLGSDLESIGAEKAGIARAGVPLVFSAPEMPDSIAQVAATVGAPLYRLRRDFDYRVLAQGWQWQFGETARAALPLPSIRGRVQLQNAAGVLAALHLLDGIVVDQGAVRAGLLRARVRGRFEVQQRAARWILDVAHNPEAAGVLAGQLAELPVTGTRHAVVGMLGDKALAEVLGTLDPLIDHWHLLDLSDQARGATAGQLLEALPTGARDRAQMCTPVDRCLAKLDHDTGPNDQVVVFGSFLTVAAVMAWMEAAEPI